MWALKRCTSTFIPINEYTCTYIPIFAVAKKIVFVLLDSKLPPLYLFIIVSEKKNKCCTQCQYTIFFSKVFRVYVCIPPPVCM